eukprot:gene1315-32668_t
MASMTSSISKVLGSAGISQHVAVTPRPAGVHVKAVAPVRVQLSQFGQHATQKQQLVCRAAAVFISKQHYHLGGIVTSTRRIPTALMSTEGPHVAHEQPCRTPLSPSLFLHNPFFAANIPKRLDSNHYPVDPDKVNTPSNFNSSFSSLMDDEDDEDDLLEAALKVEALVTEADETLKVTNLGLCDATVKALAKRGITSLFPIQKSVFEPAMQGRDMIGRAKTGSGKTLAFALPVVENIIRENMESPPKRGRSPRCIILAPTRELANQVAREFESVCPTLKVDSFYGGVSISTQIRTLKDGVDVVVGTPGRVIDLIQRGSLKLDSVRYAILDEADQMLDMGFEEDMEQILGHVPKEGRQTLLFSATLPRWIQKTAKRYLNNPLTVDLVGEENTGKLSDTIRLLVMQVDGRMKTSAMLDAISIHGAGGKTIVFVNTKAMADQIAEKLNETTSAMALHGDISQNQRERALAQFREGRYPVLVATDVAARGLDIPSVDLVLHYDIPQDTEAFLHRSGRTGRAGNTGTALVLFGDRDARSLGNVFRDAKVTTAELCGSPDPEDMMMTTCRAALGTLDKVHDNVIEFFLPAAEKLLSSEQPERVLAAALASMSGIHHPPKPRSILTYTEGVTTLRIVGPKGTVDGWKTLVDVMKSIAKKAGMKDFSANVGKIKVLDPLENGLAAVAFDLPSGSAKLLLTEGAEAAESLGFTINRAQRYPGSCVEPDPGRARGLSDPRSCVDPVHGLFRGLSDIVVAAQNLSLASPGGLVISW